MRTAVPHSLVLLLLGWLCLGTRLLHAQTTSAPAKSPTPRSEPNDEADLGVGPVVVVDELTFDTPIHLPYSVLEPLVEKLNQLERTDDPKHVWLDEFLETSIRGAWQDRGYFKVLVDGRAEPRGGDATIQHFSVALHVDEGPQYRLGTIEFTVYEDDPTGEPQDSSDQGSPRLRIKHHFSGDETLSENAPREPMFPIAQLRALIPIEEGDILSVMKLRRGLDNFKHLYGHNGYIDFTATPFTEADDTKHVVNIRMELDEQLQYHIGKIEIQGLDAATESALVWRVRPGDVFDYELFEKFFEDNKDLLPEKSSDEEAEIRRNPKQATVDVRMRFRQ
jgi:hypothetical protein